MKQIEFCEQVSQYRYQFYITAYALLKNEADAEDAVCSAILNGYEHLAQLKNPKKFKAWMLTITRNEALKLRSRRMGLPGDETVEQLLPPSYDEHNELWDIVQTLKEEYRIVIVLFYYNGLSLKDISDVLDISVGTVKSRLARGRKLLKDALGE
ncbi:MAG: sigma-70 family RNA polymerase sigma factor [Butyrivibrio sp.]|nr:sigma-70 family RNA polymerase sigma factor [Acetatifactor muris]MCM1560716.1 sigma-70 family RNA polymerase sigma factor [Butyrivibrio sp.]